MGKYKFVATWNRKNSKVLPKSRVEVKVETVHIDDVIKHFADFLIASGFPEGLVQSKLEGENDSNATDKTASEDR